MLQQANALDSKFEVGYLAPETVAAASFKLTEDQQNAITELTDWWNLPAGHKDYQNIILSGSPGTGKTFLARYFIKSLSKAVPLFTAPTNEAVRQLELSLQGDAPAKTTYSALGLTLSTHSFKQKIYQRQLPEDFYDYNLLAVDECSMAGKQDTTKENSHRLLMDYVLDAGMRTIWLGDWAQLPPVDSEDGTSPVFGCGFKTLELAQVKRHAGDILDFAMLLRSEIQKPVKNLPQIPTDIPTVKRNARGMFDLTPDMFNKIVEDEARIICWTNDTIRGTKLPGVNQYNSMIRSRLFGEELAKASDIYPTDRILFTSPLVIADKHEELTLETVLRAEFEMFASVNTRAEVLSAKPITIMGIECWKTELELEGGVDTIAYIPTNEGQRQKTEFEKKLRKEAVDAGSQKDAAEKWHFYHTWRQCFCEFKHTYCITGHRAQGASIPEVYVDVNNMLYNRDRLVAFKNLYVAATRAQRSLNLIRG